MNQSIPCENNTYDVVVSIEVIEHIENHFQFMREIIRVTKPGGLIIVTTPNILNFPSKWNFYLYGYTDCAPFPIDPTREDYFMCHINPISLPELMFHFERGNTELVDVTTNRIRKGAWIPMLLLYPLLAISIRLKFYKKKHLQHKKLFKRHVKWMLKPKNLMAE